MPDVLVRLPASLRGELKQPLGPVDADVERLLDRVEGPLIAVGDVVTFHLGAAEGDPDLSIVDDRTERSPVDGDVRAAIGGADIVVENPPGTITVELVSAIRDALTGREAVLIRVDGEEDLAALPAIVMAPVGASVVYGQPGEGMVHVRVDGDAKRRARSLLERMEGDPDRLLDLLEP